jgi:hypothetical protein
MRKNMFVVCAFITLIINLGCEPKKPSIIKNREFRFIHDLGDYKN